MMRSSRSLRAAPTMGPALGRAVAAQRGFTLMEVLVALVVFAISVVGLVALESRSIDSQRAAAQLREAERIAQQEMAALTSRGFLELIARDFAGNDNPAFPYDDSGVDPGLFFHRLGKLAW